MAAKALAASMLAVLATAGCASLEAAMLEYARCMRAHGVPNYPDPSCGKSGRPIVSDLSGQGIDTQSPAFISAARVCNGPRWRRWVMKERTMDPVIELVPDSYFDGRGTLLASACLVWASVCWTAWSWVGVNPWAASVSVSIRPA